MSARPDSLETKAPYKFFTYLLTYLLKHSAKFRLRPKLLSATIYNFK